jgi:hypothetical protein
MDKFRSVPFRSVRAGWTQRAAFPDTECMAPVQRGAIVWCGCAASPDPRATHHPCLAVPGERPTLAPPHPPPQMNAVKGILAAKDGTQETGAKAVTPHDGGSGDVRGPPSLRPPSRVGWPAEGPEES